MRAAVFALLMLVLIPASAQTVIIYSHADSDYARRLQNIARAYDVVLIDGNIEPGVRWRETVAAWIISAKVILILWSANAAASAEVAPEWRMAIASPARVIPVLLDNTQLPPGLADRQAVDWR